MNTILADSDVQQNCCTKSQTSRKTRQAPACRVSDQVAAGRVSYIAITTAHAAAIISSTTKIAAAGTAYAVAGTAVRPFVVVVAGADKNAARTNAEATTAKAMGTTIVPRAPVVNLRQALNGFLLDY